MIYDGKHVEPGTIAEILIDDTLVYRGEFTQCLNWLTADINPYRGQPYVMRKVSP